MKKFLLPAILIFALASFSSCLKVVDVPAQQTGSRLAGSWIVSAADENSGYGWQPFSPEYAHGVFQFYDPGSSKYIDGNVVFTGSWFVSNTNNSYYDENGSFYTGNHKAFETQMTDTYTGNTLFLNFDYITFVNSNVFVTTYYDGKYVERVTFSRY